MGKDTKQVKVKLEDGTEVEATVPTGTPLKGVAGTEAMQCYLVEGKIVCFPA